MIHLGRIQNDRTKKPGYIARKQPRSPKMLVNAQGDKVLISSDFGSTCTTKNTYSAPYALNIINSHPSNVCYKDDWAVACNIKRVTLYSPTRPNGTSLFTYSTKFKDKNGVQSMFDMPGNTGFNGYSAFISSDGLKRFVFAGAKFQDWDSNKNVFLYYKNGSWNRSLDWNDPSDYDVSVSEDLRTLVSIAHRSVDYGETVSSVNPGTGYTVVRTALSGSGLVLYAIREKKIDGWNISEAWLSVSYDLGDSWINVQNLLRFNPEKKYKTRRDVSLATSYYGDCVAFIYNQTHFGWSPNRGVYLYTRDLTYDLPYNQLSMDQSGYYVCITNTNIVMPDSYSQYNESSDIYTFDMHTLQMSFPQINQQFDTCIATVLLR